MLYGSNQLIAYSPVRVQFDYLRRLRDEPDMRKPFDIVNRRTLKGSVKLCESARASSMPHSLPVMASKVSANGSV